MGMREFQARHRALQAVQQASAKSTIQSAVIAAHGSDYAVLEIALQNDVNAIRALPSLELRNEYKRNRFLKKWLPFVDEYIKKGVIYQNDYFLYCIVYLFDVGDFDRALDLASTAILQRQSMPKNFKSNLATFTADQIYAWADKTAAVGLSVEPYFSQTFKNVATAWQLHEVVTAKWLKFAAALLLRNPQGQVHAASIKQPERLILAVQLCNRAFQLNPKAGVKDMISRCIMRLKKLHQDDSTMTGLSLETAEIDFDAVIEQLRSRHLSGTQSTAQKGGGNV